MINELYYTPRTGKIHRIGEDKLTIPAGSTYRVLWDNITSIGVNWIKQSLERGGTVNVPYNFMFSPLSQRLAQAHYGDDLEEALSMPIRMTGPGFVEELLENLADYIIETVRIMSERGDFECIAVSDDYGTQDGLLISPRHWRRLVKPQLKRIYAEAEKHGLARFHHSCGRIVPIIPDMIEIGLNILHPIQADVPEENLIALIDEARVPL